jgi:hypothetical protein
MSHQSYAFRVAAEVGDVALKAESLASLKIPKADKEIPPQEASYRFEAQPNPR